MRKLLLIVDDWEALEVYESRFTPHFEVHGAPFGSEGVRVAQELKPDLILLDLVFEDMSPDEGVLALQSHSLTKEIPLVVIHDSPLNLSDGKLLAGVRAVARPYDFAELLRLMKG